MGLILLGVGRPDVWGYKNANCQCKYLFLTHKYKIMKAFLLRILFFISVGSIFSAHQSHAQYCASQSNIFTDEHITDVTMGALSNASGGSSYSDYTTQTATVNPGGNPQISVTIYNGAPAGITWNEYVSVFIDWNQTRHLIL